MKYYIIRWGADIKRKGYNLNITIKCICGTVFDFNSHASDKVSHFSRCPNCNELYDLQNEEYYENHYTIVSPRTNQQLHFDKKKIKRL